MVEKDSLFGFKRGRKKNNLISPLISSSMCICLHGNLHGLQMWEKEEKQGEQSASQAGAGQETCRRRSLQAGGGEGEEKNLYKKEKSLSLYPSSHDDDDDDDMSEKENSVIMREGRNMEERLSP